MALTTAGAQIANRRTKCSARARVIAQPKRASMYTAKRVQTEQNVGLAVYFF